MKLPEGRIGHPLTGKPIDPTEHQNQTVFSSVIGAAIAGQDFCPIWRLTPIKEASGEMTLGIRTKFMEDFSSLKEAESATSSRRKTASTYNFDKLNDISVEVLTEKKLPLFFALTEILGNIDTPARNVGHHGESLDDVGQHFFMSDVDHCGKYWPLTVREIERPLYLACPNPLSDPYHYVGAGKLVLPNDRDRDPDFTACEEKMARYPNAIHQHFQALLAAVLLPNDWIDSLSKKYLVEHTNNPKLGDDFKMHRSASIEPGLIASEQFKTALSDEDIKRRWMQEILFNFARLNVQEYRTTFSTVKEPSIPIDLKQVTQKLSALCISMRIPHISDLEQNHLIRKAEAQAAQAFLKDKAIQYLSKLDRKFLRMKKMHGLPKHAQKIIGLLKTGAADWPAIQRELKEVIQSKPFKRDPKTQAAYVALFNHLNRVLPSLPSQEASSETMMTNSRSSTPFSKSCGGGTDVAGAGSEAKPASMRGGSPPTTSPS